MVRAIFLDRDGTINEDVGDLYDVAKLQFIPGAVDALGMLQRQFLLFIITNQSGIGKGLFSDAEYEDFNDYFKNRLKNEGVDIKEILHCPHAREEGCECHKPSAYFIQQLCGKYKIDVRSSFCIGDHPHDIEMARRAGTKSIYLLTGHGVKHRKELLNEPDHVDDDLYHAASWILGKDFILRGLKPRS